MVNRDRISDIKRATVGIGLVKTDTLDLVEVYGTGFMIDKNGIFLTAKHVMEGCRVSQEFFEKKKKVTTSIAVFRAKHDNVKLDLDTGIVKDTRTITYQKVSDYFPIFDIDLVFGKLVKPYPELDAIAIEEPGEMSLLDEIAVCGFPSGKQSLDPKGEKGLQRFSPSFQTGRIGGFLPFDDAPKPYGIQTDIIGVGGSSGSPIVDPNDGRVLGIAQRVLTADVKVDVYDFKNERNLQGFGTAKVGQIFGLSNHILYPASIAVRKQFLGEKVDNIGIEVTGLSFNYRIKGTPS